MGILCAQKSVFGVFAPDISMLPPVLYTSGDTIDTPLRHGSEAELEKLFSVIRSYDDLLSLVVASHPQRICCCFLYRPSETHIVFGRLARHEFVRRLRAEREAIGAGTSPDNEKAMKALLIRFNNLISQCSGKNYREIQEEAGQTLSFFATHDFKHTLLFGKIMWYHSYLQTSH